MRLTLSQLTFAAALGLAVASWAIADEPKKGKEKPKPAATEEEDSLAELEKMFVLPDSDQADDYVKFVDRIMKFLPNTDEEAQMLNRKKPLALRKAAEKIIKLEKDTKSDGYRRANGILVIAEANELLQKLAQTDDGVPDEKLTALVDKVAKHLSLGEPGQEEFELAKDLGMAFEQLGKPELARQAFESLSKPILAAKDPAIAKEGSRLAGMALRMGLKGKQVDIKGKTVDGKEFDIASLKGKVVLVDFWATWCRPCRAEHPNIQKNYETYKEKGFEVVGISLDGDKDALKEYLENEHVKWVSLHDGADGDLAVKFGIIGIPTMMLLDKEGKLVTMSARGPELGKQLAALLGPADEKKDDAKEEPKKDEKTEEGAK
jgi:thiol-disulfide isomerase/thioredoxin